MRRYTEEFKREAVAHLRETNLPMSQIARELGVSVTSLVLWKKRSADQNGAEIPAAVGEDDLCAMPVSKLVEEIKRLQKANQKLIRQREILKKAALILGEDPR